jgi:hypothetical protein
MGILVSPATVCCKTRRVHVELNHRADGAAFASGDAGHRDRVH